MAEFVDRDVRWMWEEVEDWLSLVQALRRSNDSLVPHLPSKRQRRARNEPPELLAAPLQLGFVDDEKPITLAERQPPPPVQLINHGGAPLAVDDVLEDASASSKIPLETTVALFEEARRQAGSALEPRPQTSVSRKRMRRAVSSARQKLEGIVSQLVGTRGAMESDTYISLSDKKDDWSRVLNVAQGIVPAETHLRATELACRYLSRNAAALQAGASDDEQSEEEVAFSYMASLQATTSGAAAAAGAAGNNNGGGYLSDYSEDDGEDSEISGDGSLLYGNNSLSDGSML